MVKPIKTSVIFALLSICGITTHPCFAYEAILSAGSQNHKGEWDTGDATIDNADHNDSGSHLGFRLYNTFGERNYFGVGVDYDKILGETLMGFRALDYQRKLNKRFHVGVFFGAASIDTGLPQNGYYFGTGASFYIIPQKLAVNFELRRGDGLARDRRVQIESDPEGIKPDIFLSYNATALSVHWHF